MLKKFSQPNKKQKVSSSRAFPNDNALSESDEESNFEKAINEKTRKVAQLAENEEEVKLDEPSQLPKKASTQKSEFVGKLLEQKKIRDAEHLKIKIKNQRNAAKGAVFETAEYKKLADDSASAKEHTTTPEKTTPQDKLHINIVRKITELARSKVTLDELNQARHRYLIRAGIE